MILTLISWFELLISSDWLLVSSEELVYIVVGLLVIIQENNLVHDGLALEDSRALISQEDSVIIRAQRRAHQFLSLFNLAHESDAFLVLSTLFICFKENK